MPAKIRSAIASGDRVFAAFAKWIATQNSLDSQPASLQRTIAPDGLARVPGATGREAAMLAEDRAHRELIQPDQQQQELLSDGTGLKVQNLYPKKLAHEAKFGYNTASSPACIRAQ